MNDLVRQSEDSELLLPEYHTQSLEETSIMEARTEHQVIRQYHAYYSFTTSMGIGLISLVLFWILYYRGGFGWQSQPDQEFNWHPFLMILGLVFLYSQSMLCYRTLRNAQKKKLKIIHATLHFLAFCMSVIGLKAVFDSHNLKNTPNLYSLHSWIGLVTAIIFTAQFVGGFTSFLYPGLSTALRSAILPVHTSFGIGCFTLAIVTAMTGLTEKVLFVHRDDYSKYPSEGIIINIIGASIVFYGILVLYLVNDQSYKRIALPEEEMSLSATDYD